MIKNPNCCKKKLKDDDSGMRKDDSEDQLIDCEKCDKKCPVIKIKS